MVLRGSLFLIIYSVHRIFIFFAMNFLPLSPCHQLPPPTHKKWVIFVSMVFVLLHIFSFGVKHTGFEVK